jgi:hypothetical protein
VSGGDALENLWVFLFGHLVFMFFFTGGGLLSGVTTITTEDYHY